MSTTNKVALAVVLALSAAAGLAETQTRTTSYEYDVQGRLTKQVAEPDVANDCVQTSYGYDGYGNKTSATVATCAGATGYAVSSAATPRGTSFGFGPGGRYQTSTTNATGQTENRLVDAKREVAPEI